MAETQDNGPSPSPPAERKLEKGHSLWSDAWKRLRKNRVAVVSMVLLTVVAASGYSAPLISEHLTHFSIDEQHTRLAFSPPGTEDVSADHPSYDGNKAAFEAVDLDGDGVIKCRRRRAKQAVYPPLMDLDRLTRPARTADAPNPEPSALTRRMEEAIKRLEERLPIAEVMKLFTGPLICPDLDELSRISRHFDFLFDNYDVVTGDAEPGGTMQPDGYITWKEFPKDDSQLIDARPGEPSAYANRGLTGPDAFRKLDIDGDHVIAKWEVTERSRITRYDKKHLLRNYDLNRDLTIDKSEFPGAPETHVFWLGTDGKGRDVLTRLFYGARISITIGLLTTFIALIIGVTYGSVAGYVGGRVDNIMMRIVDVMYGLPYLFIVILLIVIVGRSTTNLFIALGMVQWLNMARVVRGQVISLKTREFVEAARAIGVTTPGIIFKHLMPNTVGPVIVYSTLLVPAVILQEAFLSFLGLGVQPPDPSWGNMITEGATKLEDYYWLILWPGLALATTLFAMNFLGDGVRDAIDPKMQKN